MESEKLMYWTTLGVLAMATVTGVATEYKGWGDRLADQSIAMLSQASERATSYAEIARIVLGGGEGDAARPEQSDIVLQSEVQNQIQNELQAHLACAQRVLVRRQAQWGRMQAMTLQVKLKRVPRTIVWPTGSMVVEVPEVTETPETF
jgi:hypothetical protein